MKIGSDLMDLRLLIDQCIARKAGNKEFALFFDGDWRAEIGNTSSNVSLGEIRGEFVGEGKTPEAAVTALLASLDESPQP